MSVLRQRGTSFPKVIFGGPLARMVNKDGSYDVAVPCGKLAVPLDFASEEERSSFRGVNMDQNDQTTTFKHIPIVPVDTRTLFSRSAASIFHWEVSPKSSVSSRMGSASPRPSTQPSSAGLWKAVSANAITHGGGHVFDLAGIIRPPELRRIEATAKRKYNVWLEIGIRDENDLFDAFAMGAFNTPSPAASAADTSACSRNCSSCRSKCIPCLYLDDGVVWERSGAGPKDLDRGHRSP